MSTMTEHDGPKTYTPEQRAFLQEVYAGADQAGVKIAGIAKIQRVEDAEVGAKDAPVKIGQTGSVTVRVGKDGELLPPQGFSDEAATSVLQIDVHADVVWDSSGDAHVRYIAYAKQNDTATARQMENSRSGPSTSEWEDRMAGRPDHEAYNDPEFKDWVVESMPDSPAEAVRQALAPLVAGANQLTAGRLELPPADTDDAVSPAVPAATAAARDDDESAGAIPWWLTAVGIVVVVALLAGLGVWLLGGSDDETVADSPAAVSVDDGDAAEEVPVTEEVREPASTDGEPVEEEPSDDAVEPAVVDSTPAEEEVVETEPDESDLIVAADVADDEPMDECASGTAVDGAANGLDPLLTLTGYQPFVDLATTELWVLLCFAHPWSFGPPVDLWSFAHAMFIEVGSHGAQGFAAPPLGPIAFVLYELHDGVWTVSTETSDGPTETTIMLTAGGNSLVRTALTVEPGFQARLFIQTASTPTPNDEVGRFEVDATITGDDVSSGDVTQFVEVIAVDPEQFPGIDPDGFGPLTAGAPA
jgi:hypothetical protein